MDSNVFRKIKKGGKLFDPALNQVVDSLRPAFLFLFSDAHLDDLSGSDPIYREFDLNHMQQYVQKNYLSFDHVYKKLHIYLATPPEAYQNKDYETYNRVLQDPIGYVEELFGDPDLAMLKQLMKSIFDGPLLAGLKNDPSFAKLVGERTGEALGNVSTIREAVAGMGSVSELLTSKKEFSKYQNIIREYISREDYSFDTWSFDFDQRMRDTAFGKTFTEMVEIINTGSDKSDTFNRFVNFYSQLEFLGVTEERAGGKRKKNSYIDIYRDAAHAYFASNADYFVSDDNGVLVKAFIAYKMMGIKTEVISSSELMLKSRLLLANEDDLSSFLQGLKFSASNGFVLHSTIPGDKKVIKLPYRVLNYFNRLQLEQTLGALSVLLFRTGDDEKGVMYSEFDLLLTKCIRLFGLPSDLKERVAIDDYESAGDRGILREWKVGTSNITLAFGTNSHHKQVIYLQINLDSNA
ncbi:hypothetical protein [Pedobacter nototheniae]|uniref:hypothetical protein n=1 Tax=Pedobacter nototheniae TaxID=2488994 RepID=UPI00103E86ED|nr:hypothetical protein [Pedobacter nototheniae]